MGEPNEPGAATADAGAASPGRIEVLHTVGTETLEGLTDLLLDCVAGGASVGFLASLSRERAAAFWHRVAEGVEAGERICLVARDDTGRIAGTVQLIPAAPDNQPHRADVAKLLVHRRARQRGLASRLMQAVEAEASRLGRTLLVLDTATGSDAERLYPRLGWQRVGTIPDYALWPDGARCATTLFYKYLSGATLSVPISGPTDLSPGA